LLAGSVLAAGPDVVSITANKKTVQQHKGATQALPHAERRAVEKQVVYRFELRNMSSALKDTLTVEWIIPVEGARGETFVGAAGRTNLALPFGKTVTLETEPVTMLGYEFTSRRGAGTLSDTIRGYAIRLLNANNDPVVEKIEPASMKSQLDWTELDRPKRPADRLQGADGDRRRPPPPPWRPR
jgi:hypothetical protein